MFLCLTYCPIVTNIIPVYTLYSVHCALCSVGYSPLIYILYSFISFISPLIYIFVFVWFSILLEYGIVCYFEVLSVVLRLFNPPNAGLIRELPRAADIGCVCVCVCVCVGGGMHRQPVANNESSEVFDII